MLTCDVRSDVRCNVQSGGNLHRAWFKMHMLKLQRYLATLMSKRIGWLVGQLVGWLICQSAGWLVDLCVDWLAGLQIGFLIG